MNPRRVAFVLVWLLGFAGDGWGQQELVVELAGGVKMDFVWVEAGVFFMGAPRPDDEEEEEEDEQELFDSDQRPQNRVSISQGFWLGRFEITRAQWEAVMGTRPWEGQSGVPDNERQPAVMISWDDVQAFTARLNAALDRPIYRLPTEAEWEYACRAGTDSYYSFGSGEGPLKNYAWFEENAWEIGEIYAHEVGLKRPNPWGLFDMHGNVDEWVQDRYGADYYTMSPVRDPPGPDTGARRVLRGGNFSSMAEELGSSVRNKANPSFRSVLFGARLVREGEPFTAVTPQTWGRIKSGTP